MSRGKPIQYSTIERYWIEMTLLHDAWKMLSMASFAGNGMSYLQQT